MSSTTIFWLIVTHGAVAFIGFCCGGLLRDGACAACSYFQASQYSDEPGEASASGTTPTPNNRGIGASDTSRKTAPRAATLTLGLDPPKRALP